MSYPDVRITPEFNPDDLIHWLRIAQVRYAAGGPVTARIEGTAINIYQAGTYRAAIDLNDERPYISDFADVDA
jgi:hypothetical protein